MKYSINFQQHYVNGKPIKMSWHDENIFVSHKKALEHAMDMVQMWREDENALITFNIISH